MLSLNHRASLVRLVASVEDEGVTVLPQLSPFTFHCADSFEACSTVQCPWVNALGWKSTANLLTLAPASRNMLTLQVMNLRMSCTKA